VWIGVERLGPDTRYQQIVSLVHQALTEKPGWLSAADRFAGPFLWTVLLLAGLGALAWQWIDPSRSLWVAVSVLVVTCPCALSLAAPSALLAAAGAMAKQGVLVRRLGALESLAHIDRVFFDKTGTLTEGELHLRGLMPLGPDASMMGEDWRAHPLLRTAATLASYSQHPLSQSLAHVFEGPAMVWQNVREEAGQGLEATDELGQRWRLGSASWVLGDEGARALRTAANPALMAVRVWLSCVTPAAAGAPDPAQAIGFVFDEAFRPDAPRALKQLHDLGLRCDILSGDRDDRVKLAVEHLGANHVGVALAQARPEDKLAHIAQAQALGQRVAVVGDGINDAPVLAKADVSVALDQGSALAQSQADLLILGGRLSGVPQAVLISRRAARIIRQNLVWAAAYNLVCIPLALAGLLPPWIAGLGMAMSSLAVVLNALRLSAS
jgi:Cu2+-exporting ATPase